MQNITVDDGSEMHTVTLGLHVLAERHQFKNKRSMKIKCVATVFNIYYKVNEISIERKRRRRIQNTIAGSSNQSSE